MKNKIYNVMVSVKVDTAIEVKASSFEEALERVRDYKVKDVVEFDTDFIDGDIKITGVYE